MNNFMFSTGINVNGEIDLKELQSIPSSPQDGRYKVYVKDGKLYVLDSNGESKEVGSSVSGKVVTGIESGQDKIVISFSDGTQEEIKVITDIPTFEYMTSEEANSMIEDIWNEVTL